MIDNPPSLSNIARAAWRIAKAVGPFLISQSQRASEAYAQHHMRLAQVEVYKEAAISENRMYDEVRKSLLDRYYQADNAERFRIKRDIEDLDKEIRCIGVYQNALEHLTSVEASDSAPASSENSADEIPASWLDRFDKLARLNNEPWRQQLLSRALASEAQKLGTISPRALWFIGTMDEHIFHGFASLIDVCSVVQREYIVPHPYKYFERMLPGCALGDLFLGNATFLLSDLGLMGDLEHSHKKLFPDRVVQATYAEKRCILKIKQEMRVPGIVLTKLGNEIASLYEPRPNALGLEIFDAWINSIGPDFADVECGA